MHPAKPPKPSHRHQKYGTQLDTEWPEWRKFSYMFDKKHLRHAARIQTDLCWAELTSGPNSIVTTTRKQELAIGMRLALLTNPEPKDPKPTIFLSADLEPQQLVVYIPGGSQLPWCSTKKDLVIRRIVEDAIEKYVEASPPPKPYKDKTHEKDQFTKHKGKWGVYHLGYRHAMGHSHQPALLCHDMLRTSSAYSATLTFFREMGPMMQTIGRLFQGIDPNAYELYRLNYETQSKASALGHFRVSNRSCFDCLAVLLLS
jgi:hypothetical protein